MQYWKKVIKFFNVLVLVSGMLIPMALFANRFLIPDVSFDSVNYHLYLGFKGINWQNNKFEFYPTGIHNFSTVLDVPGYVLMKFFGYRWGSISSLIFLYLSILVSYKIFRLYKPKFNILDKWWSGLIFVSMFLSFESFLQIATYFVDIEVAFLMLLSIYFLLKYEKTGKLIDLVLSSFWVSVFVLGKMTTWYFLFPYFGYLLLVLCFDKKQTIKQKIFRFVLAGVISVSLILSWLYQNLNLTGNPVFPFYNGIFKSKYFVNYNFSQVRFGGRDLVEKLFWGIASAKYPVRLGEVHELFNDYKISIYFITTIIVFFWALFKKKVMMLKLSGFYLALYLSWSYFFGYLRYGLVLEFLGGLILLMWFDEMLTIKKYLIIIPIILVMIVQGERIVNLSLMYDISFRPGYFYNRNSYPKEVVNLKNNKIEVDESIVDKYKPNVYLNCAIPDLTYYVLSEFKNLPVFNVDASVYNDLVLNPEYMKVSKEKLAKYLNGDKVRFVTITTKEGLNNEYGDCVKNLKNKKYDILDEVVLDNFLGYKGQKLVFIFGEFIL